jgi:adenine deaminase
MLTADVARDLLKIVVVNRYQNAPPAVAIVRNFGLTRGAIASTVAHDSHNIIAVGTSDGSIARAVNLVMTARGGIVATDGEVDQLLELPIAGLMATDDGYAVGQRYAEIDAYAKALGSTLAAPFMTLSFLALLVIPKLKLSDKGLFDGEKFEFVDLFLD